jgi:hypothetical protein
VLIVLSTFGALYLVALVLFVIGTFGLLGQERDLLPLNHDGVCDIFTSRSRGRPCCRDTCT